MKKFIFYSALLLFASESHAALILTFYDKAIGTNLINLSADLKAIGGVIALVAATAWGYKAIRKSM